MSQVSWWRRRRTRHKRQWRIVRVSSRRKEDTRWDSPFYQKAHQARSLRSQAGRAGGGRGTSTQQDDCRCNLGRTHVTAANASWGDERGKAQALRQLRHSGTPALTQLRISNLRDTCGAFLGIPPHRVRCSNPKVASSLRSASQVYIRQCEKQRATAALSHGSVRARQQLLLQTHTTHTHTQHTQHRGIYYQSKTVTHSTAQLSATSAKNVADRFQEHSTASAKTNCRDLDHHSQEGSGAGPFTSYVTKTLMTSSPYSVVLYTIVSDAPHFSAGWGGLVLLIMFASRRAAR
jgi:hypothetical protein